jgi:hypothetical protein
MSSKRPVPTGMCGEVSINGCLEVKTRARQLAACLGLVQRKEVLENSDCRLRSLLFRQAISTV